MARFDLVMDGRVVASTDREVPFESGSRGYMLGSGEKITLPNGERVQVSCNLVIIGSKDEVEAASRASAVKALKDAKNLVRKFNADKDTTPEERTEAARILAETTVEYGLYVR